MAAARLACNVSHFCTLQDRDDSCNTSIYLAVVRRNGTNNSSTVSSNNLLNNTTNTVKQNF